MKVLVEVSSKDTINSIKADGVILALENYSVESVCFFSLEEIEKIAKTTSLEVFVKLNKNFMNEDLEGLQEVLLSLNQMAIKGVFFYDLAVLELWKEHMLSFSLVWNQTHMVNNYKTCDYYYSKGVEYALLGKEITLEEVLEITKKSKISTMVEVVSRPSVAFSKRKLLTNFYQDMGKEIQKDLVVTERGTKEDYHFIENKDGTSIFLNAITNGTSVIKDLYDGGVSYIILREYGLEEVFQELVLDTVHYIQSSCQDSTYVEKYKKLGDSTNFFFRKTIYRVKK